LTRWVIEFSEAARAAAPADGLREAERRLQQLADSLSWISPESPFWESLAVSRLCLVVGGWSFYYSFDGEVLTVSEALGK
jgi:hypothetical protein